MTKLSINRLCLLFAFTCAHTVSMAQTVDQKTKVLLRTVAHKFLLEIKDTSSRILPISESNGSYEVQFERSFAFQPESLHKVVLDALKQTDLNDHFLVEVKPCRSDEVAYSFEARTNVHRHDLACRERPLPNDCYRIIFTPTAVNIPPKSPAYTSWLISAGFVLVLGGVVYWRRRTVLDEDLISIGSYLFDHKAMTLQLDGQKTELSAIEANLLKLLQSNVNTTVERELILNEVWQDQGNYVGRTLDVFISKLRKKLAEDSNIRIINVRGIGYRLVIETQA